MSLISLLGENHVVSSYNGLNPPLPCIPSEPGENIATCITDFADASDLFTKHLKVRLVSSHVLLQMAERTEVKGRVEWFK